MTCRYGLPKPSNPLAGCVFALLQLLEYAVIVFVVYHFAVKYW